MIHPNHIDPANTGIHAEVTTRIDRGEFESAIEADVTGPDSTAARIDKTRLTRPARRLPGLPSSRRSRLSVQRGALHLAN